MRETFNVYDDSKTTKESIVKTLKDAKVQVLVNYLPVAATTPSDSMRNAPLTRDAPW